MEILCSLRLVDFVKNKRIWIVLSRGDVKECVVGDERHA